MFFVAGGHYTLPAHGPAAPAAAVPAEDDVEAPAAQPEAMQDNRLCGVINRVHAGRERPKLLQTAMTAGEIASDCPLALEVQYHDLWGSSTETTATTFPASDPIWVDGLAFAPFDTVSARMQAWSAEPSNEDACVAWTNPTKAWP